MRQIFLDTETTGFFKHDRIVEIGAVEMANGQIEDKLHHYVNPGVTMDAEVTRIHGITNEMLADKPDFAQIVPELIELIRGAQLIVHNAPFDIYYINFELALCAQRQGKEYEPAQKFYADLVDTLVIAREKFPGRPNSLDALIARFNIEASARAERHGALIDARLLANVYQAMCTTQSSFELESIEQSSAKGHSARAIDIQIPKDLTLVQPSAAEKEAHFALMKKIGVDDPF